MPHELVVRDPRSDVSVNSGGNAQVGAPGTAPNTNGIGGFKDAQGIDLGNGTAAVLVIVATRTKTQVAPAQTSTQLLAADVSRVAVSIQNTDTSKNLYIGLNAPAVVGTNTVPPGGVFNVPVPNVAQQIMGIWDSGASGDANVLATTA